MENDRNVPTFFLDQAESDPVEEKKSLVDFPTGDREFQAFLDSANQGKAKNSESTEKCDSVIALQLPPGLTYDVLTNCELAIRPLSAEERNADKENQEYYKSPEYKKDLRAFFRFLKSQESKSER